MGCIANRYLCVVLAAFFGVWSFVFPVTAAAVTYNAAANWSGRAWYVAGAGTPAAGLQTVASAATVLGRANPWVAALTLGMPIAQWLLETKAGEQVAVMAKDAKLAVAPPGWADSESPPPSVAPGGASTQAAVLGPQTPVESFMCYANAVRYPTWDAAVAAHMATYTGCDRWPASGVPQPASNILSGANGQTQSITCFGPPGSNNGGSGWTAPIRHDFICEQGGSLTGSAGSYGCSLDSYSCPFGGTLSGNQCINVPVCPAGYGVQGGQCVLQDPSLVKWPADAIPTLRFDDQGGWAPHPRDPDPMPQNADPAELAPGPSNVLQADPLGQPLLQTMAPNPVSPGGFIYTQSLQTTNNNQTYTTTNQITVNNAGSVVAATTRTSPGTIDTAAGTNPQTPFPDDYNKELTQQKIYSGDGAQDAPDFAADVQTKAQLAEEAITNQLEALPGQYASDKSSWFSWVWTPPMGVCTMPSDQIRGHTVSFDLCPYIEKIRDVIGWLFAVFGTWVIYLELFRRDES